MIVSDQQIDTLANQPVRGDIAIVGMACTFPRARNLVQFWQNIVAGVDATHEVPPERWDPKVFYDKTAGKDGKVYCKRGGFLGSSFVFNPLKFGTMPRALDGGEPDQFLVLRTAYEAIADAGLSPDNLPGERTGLILGRGNYLGAGQMGVIQRGLILEQTLQSLRAVRPDLDDEAIESIRSELLAQLPGWGADTAPGVIPNISAGRIANRLNLMGPTFTVDAACASSLIATEIAVRGLLTNQFDLALAGGVHVCCDVPFLQVFCALGALSPTETIRPYSKNCDGTLAGEGVGLVVLKRLADAQANGDRIYAVIRGVGSSSDGRALSVTAPRPEGGELALHRAYEMAGVDPTSITLVEGHGTGTTVGDENELTVLRRVLGTRTGAMPQVALGSVKSMIGHSMPAAGVASLIKTALSIYHAVLPPTLHCDAPHGLLLNSDTPLYLNTKTRPWMTGGTSGLRRAGINAFGFGGVNAHVVLEQYAAGRKVFASRSPQSEKDRTLLEQWECELVVLSADSRGRLLQQLRDVIAYVADAEGVKLRDIAYTLNTASQDHGGEHRLAIVASTTSDLGEKMTIAAKRLAAPDCRQIKDAKGIYYLSESPLRSGKLAFVFPGLGSQYVNQFDDLCIHFGEIRDVFEHADRTVDLPGGASLSQRLFPPSPASDRDATQALSSIDVANPAVATANGAMFTLLDTLGIGADMMTGHSSGEWVAMPASGMVPTDEFIESMRRLNGLWFALRSSDTIAHKVMLNIGADRDTVLSIAGELDTDIEVANDNCPHQVVAVVAPRNAERVIRTVKKRGLFVEQLPLEHGYHTKEFTYVTEGLRDYFAALPLASPHATLYSSTTAKPYPSEPDEVVELLAHTFAKPLLFRDTIEQMYEDGARIFLEVGPRANLTAFIDDILRGKPHAAVATNQHRKTGMVALHHALAQLAALHVPMSLATLYERRGAKMLTLDPQKDSPVGESNEPGAVNVSLCVPQMVVATKSPPVVTKPMIDSSVEREASQDVNEVEYVEFTSTSPIPPGPIREAETASNGPAAASLHEHFKLMESFLETNREVMEAFLGAPSQPAGTDTTNVLSGVSASLPPEQPAAGRSEPPRDIAPDKPEQKALKTTGQPSQQAPLAVASSAETVETTLLQIVSDRTGYPPDMLDLDLDMEADLGIDSIKRIEILGSLQQADAAKEFGGEIDMEEVARVKTLRGVLDFLGAASAAPTEKSLSLRCESQDRPEQPDTSNMAFPGDVVEYTPKQRVVVVRDVNLDEDIYLMDHCFDRFVSDADPDRERLCIVPLTVSVETMAEVASLLAVNERVVAARNLQASRWIEVEKGADPVRLRIEAVRAPESSEASVTIRHDSASATESPLAEGTFAFDAAFPACDLPGTNLQELQPPRYTPRQMYDQRHMFHGPRFHGVHSLDGICDQGLRASLKVLPTDHLVRSSKSPRFVFDPFLLDAAGQLVGYWPLERLSEGFVLFPIRIGEIQLFCENLSPGEVASCDMVIDELSARKLSATMTLTAPNGKVWMRIAGWEDWRFYWQPIFNDFRRFPNLHFVSEVVDAPIDNAAEIECRRLAPFGDMQSPIWENLWAHLILGRRELAEYRAMKPGERRAEWIFGRAVAKDAVRAWIKRRYGLDIYPADVCITPDASGKPIATGFWTEQVKTVPRLSISHKNGVAMAVAAAGSVGIDLETITERAEGFENVAFSNDERAILTRINGGCDRHEWLTRAWCAKEAAGKAVGTGLKGNPLSLALQSVDLAAEQLVVLCGEPDSKGKSGTPRSLLVQSFRDGEYIVALAHDERTNGDVD